MGVECELIGLVGLKLDYSKYQVYKSKNDPDYMYDLQDGRLDDKICLFEDYFPENFISVSDYMSCEYVYIGLKLFETQYIDIGIDLSVTPEELTQQIDRVKPDLEALKIDFDIKDIKLHVFTHFW